MLTQAQSLENLLLSGMSLHGGEQLLLTDGLGVGTTGGTTSCTDVALAYDTGGRITLTTEIDFTLSSNRLANLGGISPCLPYEYDSGADYSDGAILTWGPFQMVVMGQPGLFTMPTSTGWLGGANAGPYDFVAGGFGTNCSQYVEYDACGNVIGYSSSATDACKLHHSGQFTLNVGGYTFGTTQTALFDPPSGHSGKLSLSIPVQVWRDLNSDIGTFLKLDQSGTYSATAVYGGQTLTQSGTVSTLFSGVTGYFAPYEWQILYTGPSIAPVYGPIQGSFSITSAKAFGQDLDITCTAAGTYTIEPTFGGSSLTVTEMASGGMGTFTYTATNHAQINLILGFPVTPTFVSKAMDAFGGNSSHPPDLLCQWNYYGWSGGGGASLGFGVLSDFNFQMQPGRTTWGNWPTGPFQHKVIGPIPALFDASYVLAGDVYTGTVATDFLSNTLAVNPFQRALMKYQRPAITRFTATAHPDWCVEHNLAANACPIVFRDQTAITATTLSLASSVTLDTFSDVSAWIGTGATVSSSGGLHIVSTTTGGSAARNTYAAQATFYRYLKLTLSGTAQVGTVSVGSGVHWRKYCLPVALTSTPQDITIDLCETHTTDHYVADGTQFGFGFTGTGDVWGPDAVTGLEFGNLANGETLTCSAAVFYRDDVDLEGGVEWRAGPYIYLFSDRKVGDVNPLQYDCIDKMIAAINDQTAVTGLSATAPVPVAPTTTYNGGLSPEFLEFRAVGTMGAITARINRGAASTYAGNNSFTIDIYTQCEHFCHGLTLTTNITSPQNHIRVSGSQPKPPNQTPDAYLTPDSLGYFRSGSRFPPSSEQFWQGPDDQTALGNGPYIVVPGTTILYGFAQSQPGFAWAGVSQFFLCTTLSNNLTGGGVWLLRDYTDRLHIYGANTSGNMVVNIYDDNDANPTPVTIDSATLCTHPSFNLNGVLIDGTYLANKTPKWARSRTHGRQWQVYTVPGVYDACTSCSNHARVIFIGFRKGNPAATPPTSDAWYVRVGLLQDDGTYMWSEEVNLNLTAPNGSGHVKERFDGVCEFVWEDNSGNQYVLRGRLIPNSGGNGSEWT